jgi:hypothetical protein
MSFQDHTQSDPEIVYHYTSMDTFLKIVESQQLWATDVAYLNDTSEQEHFFQRALGRLPKVLSKRPEWQEWNFEVTSSHITPDIVSIATSPFLTSFSSDDDSLPQWRAYCPQGNGISIGFRVENLKQATLHMGDTKDPFGIDHRLKWGRVEYDCVDSLVDLELEKILAELATQASSNSQNDPRFGSKGHVLRTYIRGRAVFYKHDSFKAEKEYRLILPGVYWLRSILHFSASKSTLRPHVKFDIPALGTSQSNQTMHSTWNAVAEVRIGPTPNPALTAASVHTMLYDRRINCDLKISEIPFRNW